MLTVEDRNKLKAAMAMLRAVSSKLDDSYEECPTCGHKHRNNMEDWKLKLRVGGAYEKLQNLYNETLDLSDPRTFAA